jgi:hypothetical protein
VVSLYLATLSLCLALTRRPTRKPTRQRTRKPSRKPSRKPVQRPVSIPTYSPAPPATNEFICPKIPGSISISSYGISKFYVSESNQLCTLVQTASDQRSFKPVGRSYSGHGWEASSGEFSHLSWKCNDISCDVDLPLPPQGSAYQLTSFDTSSTVKHGSREEIARFLEQTTFGPTLFDIAEILRASNFPQSFAEWIHKQQQEVPQTSHREMFRKRMNSRMETATYNSAVTHPCQKDTRYRRYAFTAKDREKYMDIETVGGKKILRVDGFVRTVVNGPIFNTWYPSREWPDGR